ncbi:MAG: DUF92 domain-containing protein [Methanoregulaceae archaeon]|nr:DUF92 domain-containing protein [Methanoregulaceae archaeon]
MLERPGAWLSLLLIISGVVISPFIQPPWFLAVIVIIFSLVLALIEKTRYIAIAIIVISGLYGLGILPLFVFSSTLAILGAGEIAFRAGKGGLSSYLLYIAGGATGCMLVMLYLGVVAPLVILFGVVVAVLLKAILGEREDALMIEALGIAMTMALFHELDYQADLSLIAVAILVAFSFGYFAYRSRTADMSGLFSGALIGLILIVFAGVPWFLVMLAFFILGSACTRYRFEYKEKLGVEQSHGGARGYRNVFANGLVSAVAAVLYGVTGNPVFSAMFVGSVATAAADTVASEIGVTGGRPWMITTFRRVDAGTNGGVTGIGEISALGSSVVISVVAFALGMISPVVMAICVIAGVVGTNIDSLAGSLLENRGLIGNAGTNILGTLGGGLFALGLLMLL